MLRSWLAPAHAVLVLTVVVPATAEAQERYTRSLADPSASIGPHLGRELGDPSAPPPIAPRGWALDLSAQTSLPLSVGVEAQLESPIGITAHFALGHTPAAYLGLVADVLRDNGVYGPNLDPLVSDAISNGAWNVRAGLGYTFDVGLELAAGYTYLGANANLSIDSIEAATGQRFRWPGMDNVPLALEVHALHGRIGWRFVIERHLVLRFALGWTHAVANSVHATVPQELDPPGGPADQFEEDVRAGISEYGFTPELLLGAGYRF